MNGKRGASFYLPGTKKGEERRTGPREEETTPVGKNRIYCEDFSKNSGEKKKDTGFPGQKMKRDRINYLFPGRRGRGKSRR